MTDFSAPARGRLELSRVGALGARKEPRQSAIVAVFRTRGGAVWQLVGLITRRSQVQILPPQPSTSKACIAAGFFCFWSWQFGLWQYKAAERPPFSSGLRPSAPQAEVAESAVSIEGPIQPNTHFAVRTRWFRARKLCPGVVRCYHSVFSKSALLLSG